MSLSKSQYLRGLQCPKSLWLYNHRKDLIPPTPQRLQMIFDQGNEVGQWARKRFPGGTLIAEDHHHPAEAVQATVAAMAAGASVLYEPAFLFDDVLVRLDVLLRNPDGTWDMIEVKGTTAVKETHLQDLAIQRYVVEGSGWKVRKALLMHIDNRYVRRGDIDVDKLFTLADATATTGEMLPGVPAKVKEFHETVAFVEGPEIAIGPHCSKPYGCDFISYCWAHVQDAVPETAGRENVEAAPIREHLNKLAYPLYFLDFETVNPAIPPYDGLRPFQHLPFQASLHIQRIEGGPVEHVEFLGDGRTDPRPGLASCLAEAIGASGSVVAYNAGFEGSCLEDLGLRSIKDRLWDLANPFRKGHYAHPGFRGTWRLKSVLPALVPEMSYEDFPIGEGSQAQLAYLALMKGKLPDSEAQKLLNDLKRYCAQDTLGLVALLRHLKRTVEGQNLSFPPP